MEFMSVSPNEARLIGNLGPFIFLTTKDFIMRYFSVTLIVLACAALISTIALAWAHSVAAPMVPRLASQAAAVDDAARALGRSAEVFA